MTARLPPTAAASALRSRWRLTGTTPTARAPPSTTATSVLNIRSGGTPSAALASRPNESARGSCVYSCKPNEIFARSRASVAVVPRVATNGHSTRRAGEARNSVTYPVMSDVLAADRVLMALALEQARASLDAGGVPVGAVLAAGGEGLAAGHNKRGEFGDPGGAGGSARLPAQRRPAAFLLRHHALHHAVTVPDVHRRDPAVPDPPGGCRRGQDLRGGPELPARPWCRDRPARRPCLHRRHGRVPDPLPAGLERGHRRTLRVAGPGRDTDHGQVVGRERAEHPRGQRGAANVGHHLHGRGAPDDVRGAAWVIGMRSGRSPRDKLAPCEQRCLSRGWRTVP